MKTNNWLGHAGFRVTCGDANGLMEQLEDSSVDLIVTDPAYSSLEKHRAVGTTTRLKKAWFPVVDNSYFHAFFRQAYRVLKKNAHMYLFCDQETMFTIKPFAEEKGFKFWKPLVWNKVDIGMGYHYRNTYEFILFFEKGKRRLANLGTSDVLIAKRIRGQYPTEKPPFLAGILINQSSWPGDVVLDPFCGSGAFGEAAILNGRRFIGGDVVQSAVGLTETRLRGL